MRRVEHVDLLMVGSGECAEQCAATPSSDIAIPAFEAAKERRKAAEKALAYGRQAGEQAHGLHAPRAAIEHFTRALEGRKTRLTPWLQDFSLGRTYTIEDVLAQVAAARGQHTGGFLLWNAEGLYDASVLQP